MASTFAIRPDEEAAPGVLRHVPSVLVLAGVVALFASVGGGLSGGAVPPSELKRAEAASAGLERTADGQLLPKAESDPTALAQISPTDALFRNAALPIDDGPNPAAAAFRLAEDQVARMRSIDCLTAAIYYEAGLEPIDGQRAVAQVVLNRVRHPAYPNTVCGVVFQGHQRTTGCQFTFTCDGALRRTPAAHLWERSRRVAEEALAGYVHRPVGWATHYHANYVFPYWAPTLTKVATVGAHIFYRWDGGGRLTARYAGAEPDIRWRGGFGQNPEAGLAAAAAAAGVTVGTADAAAAAAAVEAQRTAPQASVDSFQRAILRRYEPVNTQQVLSERAEAVTERSTDRPASTSSRWALTGQGSPSSETQRPLGRAGTEPPRPLEGIRRRPEAAPAPATTPAGNSSAPR